MFSVRGERTLIVGLFLVLVITFGLTTQPSVRAWIAMVFERVAHH